MGQEVIMSMIQFDFFWLLFFAIELFLLATSLGLWALDLNQSLKIPDFGRFCIGFSATPFIIGIYFMAMAFLPHSAGRMRPIAIVPVWIFIAFTLWKKRKFIFNKINAIFTYITKNRNHMIYYIFLLFALPLSIVSAFVVYGALPYWALNISLVFSSIICFLTIDRYCHQYNYFYFFILLGIIGIFSFFYKQLILSSSNLVPSIKNIILFIAIIIASLFVYYLLNKNKIPQNKTLQLCCFLALVYSVFAALFPIFMNSVSTVPILGSIVQLVQQYLVTALPMIYAIIPAAFACVILFPIVKKTFPETKHIDSFIRKAANIFLILLFILNICNIAYSIICSLFNNMNIMVDAPQYLAEGKYFLSHFGLQGINTHAGAADGSVIASTHSFSWQSYLAYGLLHSFGDPGFGNDIAARFAFAFTLVFLIMALFAFVSLANQCKYYLITFVLITNVYMTHNILLSYSRDGYRMTGFLLFVALFVSSALSVSEHKKISLWHILLPLAGGAMAMMGHLLNAILAIPVVLAITLYFILEGKFTTHKIVYLYISAGLGALIGASQIIVNFFTTGSMSGAGGTSDSIFAATPYAENYAQAEIERLGGATSYIQRLLRIYLVENSYFILIALVVSLLTLILFIVLRKKIPIQNNGLLFILVGLVNAFFIFDFIRWGGYPMSEWLVMNRRYAFPIPLLLIPALCASASYLIQVTLSISRKTLTYPLYVLGSLYLCFTFLNGSLAMPYIFPAEASVYLDQSTGKTLVGDISANYYLNNQGITIFSNIAKPILSASSVQELSDRLQENHISIIVMNNSYDAFWSNGPIEQFLNDPERIQKVDYINSIYTVYYLK